MARYERFSFLCDSNERRAIADLAARLKRSQSDAVRFVVMAAVRKLVSQAPPIPIPSDPALLDVQPQGVQGDK